MTHDIPIHGNKNSGLHTPKMCSCNGKTRNWVRPLIPPSICRFCLFFFWVSLFALIALDTPCCALPDPVTIAALCRTTSTCNKTHGIGFSLQFASTYEYLWLKLQSITYFIPALKRLILPLITGTIQTVPTSIT